MQLRTTLALVLVVLGAVGALTSGSLILLTTWLNRASIQLGESIESVRLAERAVEQVLLHERATDPVIRADLEFSLRQNLSRSRDFVTTEEESVVLDRAEEAVDRYLTRTGADREDAERAFTELRELAALNLDQAHQAQRDAARWDQAGDLLGTVGAAAVPVVIVLTIWWVDRSLRPVFDLGRAMDAFARGDRDARAPETGPAELRDMAVRFNALASTLARRREEQLAFLAGVAHDLRTPMSALRTATALVQRDRELPPEPVVRNIVELMGRQVDQMEHLLTDLLDSTRLDAGRFTINLGAHDLRPLVSEVVQLLAAGSPTHHIKLELPDQPVVASCDPARMQQVVTNLVSNALKYSPDTSEVEVAVRVEDGAGAVAIRDHGHGIPKADQQAMFEPYRRVGPDSPARGAGMGLYVARRIVEAHGGGIEVDSEPGQGSTFRVRVPLAPTPSA